MKIITISGKAGSGKDTFANYLRSALEDDGYPVLITHYADLLKFICREYFGWNGEKDEDGRTLLQFVGTDVIRSFDPDYWVSFIHNILCFFPAEWEYVIIPDLRFPNELDYLKQRRGAKNVVHIHIDRPEYQSALTANQKNHKSETALDGAKPDVTVRNNGDLEKLRKNADAVKLFLEEYYGKDE